MNNTALRAEAQSANNTHMVFANDEHEKFYYEKLEQARYQDCYHKALIYILGISEDTRNHFSQIYDMKSGFIKPECLHQGWQTSGSVKVVRLAFNLYTDGTPSIDDYKRKDEQILKERIEGMEADIQTAKANLPADKEQFSMKVGDKVYTDKKEAGAALVEMCKEMKTVNVTATVGEYAGFKMAVSFDSFNHKIVMNLKGQLSHNLEVGFDPLGNIARINHALESMPKQLSEAQTKLETVERQLETAKVEVTKPFVQEAEFAEKEKQENHKEKGKEVTM